MDLHVEINVVHFPMEKPDMCLSPDPHKDKETGNTIDNPEWKAQVLKQKAEVHLIKIGPVTEEFLSRKKLNPALDFLQGVKFTLTEDNDYLWTSGETLKGLPINSMYQLLSTITKMGYVDDYDRFPNPKYENKEQPVKKYCYVLKRKF